ncbi:beta-N-acetylhexosaminidase [Maribacter sp. 2307ULW6-5]|uniref:beta-N-acetylhexosaminidase n=1 Tax=Maribacter sp. 2307ULW6-5 TaxID=3386275 RepID=UPI0039BD12E4
MRNILLTRFLFLAGTLLALMGCKDQTKPRLDMPRTDLSKEALIPKPLKITPTHNAFALDRFTAIYTAKEAAGFEDVGRFLARALKEKTNLDLAVNGANEDGVQRVIYINQAKNLEDNAPEGYQLYINQDSIILNANTSEGAFRGIQTLRQLVPPSANDTLAAQPIWPVPTGKINDAPQFGYRGSMLDVARHFFSLEDVKKYMDLLAYYKINVLHLHLTDDQGWRIEIKSWPLLTEIGGSTEVGGEAGGFYTQEDYKELVHYAAERYITIIPEVDMPGHTNAASVAYPFLNGNGKTPELYEGIEVGFSTFDTRKDTVYAFVDDVVREISEMTPGPYFHMGGDESHVTEKDDYIHFVNKVEKIVQKHGKRMIGWDEVAVADVDSTSISQWWSSEENAKKAVEKGMQVIVSPAKKAYLDMKYDSLSKFGLHWAGLIPVDTAYIWSPEEIGGFPMDQILGVEAPLWSETISTMEELEYLAFPRMIGYAELSWSAPAQRNWEDYKSRLVGQVPYLDQMGVNYYPSPLIDWPDTTEKEKAMPKD